MRPPYHNLLLGLFAKAKPLSNTEPELLATLTKSSDSYLPQKTFQKVLLNLRKKQRPSSFGSLCTLGRVTKLTTGNKADNGQQSCGLAVVSFNAFKETISGGTSGSGPPWATHQCRPRSPRRRRSAAFSATRSFAHLLRRA